MKRVVASSLRDVSGTEVYQLTREGILKNSDWKDNIWFEYAVSLPFDTIIESNTLGDYQAYDKDSIYVMYTDGEPISDGDVELDDPLDLFDRYDPEEFSAFLDIQPATLSQYKLITDSDIEWGRLNFDKVAKILSDDGYSDEMIEEQASEIGIELNLEY